MRGSMSLGSVAVEHCIAFAVNEKIAPRLLSCRAFLQVCHFCRPYLPFPCPTPALARYLGTNSIARLPKSPHCHFPRHARRPPIFTDIPNTCQTSQASMVSPSLVLGNDHILSVVVKRRDRTDKARKEWPSNGNVPSR